jgi:L-asparaginase
VSNVLPLVSVITLGGTIASVANAQGHDAVPELSPDDLVGSVPLARQVARLRTSSFRQYPSGDLTLEDIVELAGLIESESETADGIVITQGTDTLEETSFLLDLLVTTDIPVVLTGAMRNAGLPGADGPANLLAALRVAASADARGMGPLVVFGDEVHLPRFVRKLHSSSVTAFGSRNAGPVGWVTEDRVRLPLVPRTRRQPVPLADVATPLPSVGILKVGLGTLPLAPEAAAGFDGIVVEVLGGGHVPRTYVDSLTALLRDIPVVMATRAGAGELYESTYGFPGSEQDLLERGVISAGWLDGPKARVLLTILLTTASDRTDVERGFRDYLG